MKYIDKITDYYSMTKPFTAQKFFINNSTNVQEFQTEVQAQSEVVVWYYSMLVDMYKNNLYINLNYADLFKTIYIK